MKNPDIFNRIESRSRLNINYQYPTGEAAMKRRIVAAYENWIANRGHYTLLRIARDMKVPYNDLVDYATGQIQSMFPDVQFESKRPEIVPENDYVQMARLEAGAYVSHHEQMTFEAFYLLKHPVETIEPCTEL